ncbi:MAG: acyl-CoA dehydratase activase [Candidatus Aminicenantia bacterium]
MESKKFRLGIDCGSIYLKLALLDEQDEIAKWHFQPHHGNSIKTLKQALQKLNINHNFSFGVTGATANLLTDQIGIEPINSIQAQIIAVKKRFPYLRNIINIGGSSVTLIQLDENGNFQNFSINSLCAAGTGSFLNQQAERLEIKYHELKDFPNISNPPSIATRCAVFAKTDLIHCQQDGYSKPEMWSGLCRGMIGTFLNSLLRGKPLEGLTVITGGVALNREVIKWLKHQYGELIQTYPYAHLAGAEGAAYLANGSYSHLLNWQDLKEREEIKTEDQVRQPPLVLKKSKYPDFKLAEFYIDELANEISITYWPENRVLEVYIGFDVGSTSTKLILIDKNGQIIADIYRQTAGDPIQATKNLFSAIQKIAHQKNSKLEILGVGTTGSGRKIVGLVVGADTIINEITSHLTGTMSIDPEIDTIFEIGGQDSKYMRAKNGFIYDSNMNYVCAAGTGSFIEEQAKKLGYLISEVGDVVMGVAPPFTSDRCTVFMEQDLVKLIRQGYTKREAMAAAIYSIAQNYLRNVVGNRYRNKQKIFFQGATARNKGLVAAFENLLDVEVKVSPYCHVMGAYGVALLTKEKMEETRTISKFKGLDLAQRKIDFSFEYCSYCPNHCKITRAHIEGEKETPSWGYLCGREPEDEKMRITEDFSLFIKRDQILRNLTAKKKPSKDAPTIEIPRSLYTYLYYPFWKRFFSELGFNTSLSQSTSQETIKKGGELSGAEFCLPLKIALGHAYQLAENGNYVFLPYLISSELNKKTTNSCFCPYVQSASSVIKTVLSLHKMNFENILDPVVDFYWKDKQASERLFDSIGKKLKVSQKEILNAWKKAKLSQKDFETKIKAEGERVLAELERKGEKGIVILGRPYNIFDPESNLNLPQKISELGYRVIPIDFLPVKREDLDETFFNMYWSWGQTILTAAKYVRENKNLFGIYLTNFNCGPDSFLLSYAENIMGSEPFLILELDEHGGDAGYITRIEAFFDVIKHWKQEAGDKKQEAGSKTRKIPTRRQKSEDRNSLSISHRPSTTDLRNRKIWIPAMHDIGSRIFASAFRRFGYMAEALPPENQKTFQLGKSVTRGSECLPMAVTIGSFLSKLREINADPREHALFMATSQGPCRFGQYVLLQKMILERKGYKDLSIISPSAANAYLGLEESLRKLLWKAILISDIVNKMVLKIRPYERYTGQTDRVLKQETKRLEYAFEKNLNLEEEFKKTVKAFTEIPTYSLGTKPLVGIVGEIFVRCNIFSNDNVIRYIEKFGGEAWLTSTSEWILYTNYLYRWKIKEYRLGMKEALKAFLTKKYLLSEEERWFKLAEEMIFDRREPHIEEIMEEAVKYLPKNFGGEAVLTIGRTIHFAKQGVKMVVNVSPFSCMPGSVTSALFEKIQSEIRIPVINMVYDGEEGLNSRLEAFFKL